MGNLRECIGKLPRAARTETRRQCAACAATLALSAIAFFLLHDVCLALPPLLLSAGWAMNAARTMRRFEKGSYVALQGTYARTETAGSIIKRKTALIETDRGTLRIADTCRPHGIRPGDAVTAYLDASATVHGEGGTYTTGGRCLVEPREKRNV